MTYLEAKKAPGIGCAGCDFRSGARDGRHVEHGEQSGAGLGGDGACGVEDDGAGAEVAVDAAADDAVELGGAEEVDAVGGFRFADGGDELHADEFASVAESESELADAAGTPFPDRNGAGNFKVVFGDDRFDGFGDGVEVPAEGGAEEADRFGMWTRVISPVRPESTAAR